VRCHLHEDFPIEALLVEADSAPTGDILENLERDRIDRAPCLARADTAGDEPTAHEILKRPSEASKAHNRSSGGLRRGKRSRRKQSADAESHPMTKVGPKGNARQSSRIEKSGKEQNQAASSKDLGLSFPIRKRKSRFSGSGMLCVKALKFTSVRGSESGSAT
jgi:hypothetical protein